MTAARTFISNIMIDMAVTEPILHQVAIDRRALAAALRQLVGNPQMVAYGQAGVNRTPRLIELIVRELHPVPRLPPSLPFPAVCVTLGDGGGPLRQQRLQILRWWDEAVSPVGPIALLSIEQRPQRGQVTGVLLTSANALQPVHVLKLVGPGMQRVWTQEGESAFPAAPLTTRDRKRWSRLIGAVGEESWQTLRALRFCLVGVGRTGSVVAASLARMGVRCLTLIDPDRLELHNLDAMEGVTEKDLGRFKVAGVQKAVTALSDGVPLITALPDSILTLRAFVSAKEADVLICCADHDGARLATGVIAALYARPLLDIGAGVFGVGDARRMGGDVRLILPDDRCLLCLGGVVDVEQARQVFTAQNSSQRRSWNEERAGSLRSLNQITAHLGVRLLEDLVGERVQESRWLRLEFDQQGIPTVQVITPQLNPTCLLCRHTGQGDAGLASVREILSALPDG